MFNMDPSKLSDMLLQSLYDFHFANAGAGYRLSKAMLDADENSKKAIEGLLENGYATNSGEGTDSLTCFQKKSPSSSVGRA